MTQPTKSVILIVEDEPLILIHSRIALEDAGYEVIAVPDGDTALMRLEQRSDITALFTDVNLPGALDGLTLARRVCATRPDVAIFVTSGVEPIAAEQMPAGSRFVSKPYTGAQIARMVAAA